MKRWLNTMRRSVTILNTSIVNKQSDATMQYIFFFFFQAEDGIRDKLVTGVQTCALPICPQMKPGVTHSSSTVHNPSSPCTAKSTRAPLTIPAATASPPILGVALTCTLRRQIGRAHV